MKNIGTGRNRRAITSVCGALVVAFIVSVCGSISHAQPRLPARTGNKIAVWLSTQVKGYLFGKSNQDLTGGSSRTSSSSIATSSPLLDKLQTRLWQAGIEAFKPKIPVLTSEEKDTLEVIGVFTDKWLTKIDRTSQLLEGIGFGRQITNSIIGWNSMSSLEKLECAYRYAIKYSPQIGGKKMIVALLSSLSKDYPGDETISAYVNFYEKKYGESIGSMQRETIETFIMGRGIFPVDPIIETPAVRIDEETRHFINRIADFIDSHRESTLHLIINQIKEECNPSILAECRAFSGTTSQLLAKAFGSMSTEDRRTAMEKIAVYLAVKYPASFREFASTGRRNTPTVRTKPER